MTEFAPDQWLRRVQALLAKAESTEFPEEAEALVAKAQELMTRHSIDEAMLAQDDPSADLIDSEVVVVSPPYASAHVVLLSTVADANSCRCVSTSALRGPVRCVLVGFRGDIGRTKTMFAALSLHAARAMLAAPVPDFDTPRRFRRAFLLGFASRIGARLQDAALAARTEAEERASARGRSTDLVLADRSARVDSAFEARFPHVRRTTAKASSWAGSESGRDAADRAPLSSGTLASSRGQLQ